eukprot:TRINITY_DN6537_c0_g1_i2.p1 TRINITY_DN6537_c0_g1~~TRINITY_DN6537_c0_g1_i2.p1  ORF type:complete len:271 (+),score=37.81 TRINITY_DN6537_c0_g1_i2:49-813(+)
MLLSMGEIRNLKDRLSRCVLCGAKSMPGNPSAECVTVRMEGLRRTSTSVIKEDGETQEDPTDDELSELDVPKERPAWFKHRRPQELDDVELSKHNIAGMLSSASMFPTPSTTSGGSGGSDRHLGGLSQDTDANSRTTLQRVTRRLSTLSIQRGQTPIDLDSDSPRTNKRAFVKAEKALRKCPNIAYSRKLQLEAYKMQATRGPVSGPRPHHHPFDCEKWDMWARLKKMDKQTARNKYFMLVEKLAPGWNDMSDR